MRTIKGPALFLAQFIGDSAPFDSWDGITRWAAEQGYLGVQVPTHDARILDLDRAEASQDYRDEFLGVTQANGVAVTELSTHLQGQLVAVHPAYDAGFDAFAPETLRGRPGARQWKRILSERASQGTLADYDAALAAVGRRLLAARRDRAQ